jgi:DNA (cytosine-5)-methyltransferase 1
VLLQTFPEDYDFGEEIKTVEASRHIGNAVPPKLGLVIGKQIVNHIRKNYV